MRQQRENVWMPACSSGVNGGRMTKKVYRRENWSPSKEEVRRKMLVSSP
jgi:hypothetical protein